jgi:hypothetical protein
VNTEPINLIKAKRSTASETEPHGTRHYDQDEKYPIKITCDWPDSLAEADRMLVLGNQASRVGNRAS